MCWLLLVIWFEYKISRTISNPRLEITCFNPVELTPSEAREGGSARQIWVSNENVAVTGPGVTIWWYYLHLSASGDIGGSSWQYLTPALSVSSSGVIWVWHFYRIVIIKSYYVHFMTGSQCRTNMTRPGVTHQSVASYNYLPIHPLRRRLKHHRYDHRAKYLGPVSN